jgi:hypothetical protein
MKTGLLILVSIAIATIPGCASSQPNFHKEQTHCQKLDKFLEFCREQKAKEVISYYEDGRTYATEWEEFEKVLCAFLGCTPPCESFPNGWKACLALRQIWPAVEKENIQRIVFCSGTDVDDIENWRGFEVPEKALKKSVRLLGKALKESEKRGISWDPGADIWGTGRMKIITDKGKYIIPVNWTNEKIYGNDWRSNELRSFLREEGFKDP